MQTFITKLHKMFPSQIWLKCELDYNLVFETIMLKQSWIAQQFIKKITT